jgi:hypothetical protein
VKRKFHKRHGERLLKLADYIEKMPAGDKHEKGKPGFDFSVIAVKQDCGTAACAVGSMPQVWPDKFRYGDDYGRPADTVSSGDYISVFPVRLGRPKTGRSSFMNIPLARAFFGLTEDESNALFLPFNQYGLYGLPHLENFATGAEVARNIRRFVERKTECLSQGSQSLG